jgi:hypothetical protein
MMPFLVSWQASPRSVDLPFPAGLPQEVASLDNSAEALPTTIIDIPDLDGVTIDSASIAPDGYEFSLGKDRYSGDIFSGLFYSSRYRHEAVLRKDGRSIRLPNPSAQHYTHQTHFIGWVVPE